MYWDPRVVRDTSAAPRPPSQHAKVWPAAADESRLQESLGVLGQRPSLQTLQIALVGHESMLAELLARLLAGLGYRSCVYESWPQAADEFEIARIGMVVLDLQGVDAGCDSRLVSHIRDQVKGKPPIFVLATDIDEQAIAKLYEAGADEVMFKPLRTTVFVARMQALARRAYPSVDLPPDVLKVSGYTVDVAARRVSLNGQYTKLSQREFDLALYLFRNLGKLVTRVALEKAIWGRELDIDSKTLDTHIYRLRVKLRLQPENGLQLASVYAQGFRLMAVMPQMES